MRTPAARVAAELTGAGVELSPGEPLRFLYVPGPEKARAWDLIDAPTLYDDQAYTVLLLRALESLFAPVGVDNRTLALWLLGNAGYWGPPGSLPPPGVDARWPLLATGGRLAPRVACRSPAPPPAEAAVRPESLSHSAVLH